MSICQNSRHLSLPAPRRITIRPIIQIYQPPYTNTKTNYTIIQIYKPPYIQIQIQIRLIIIRPIILTSIFQQTQFKVRCLWTNCEIQQVKNLYSKSTNTTNTNTNTNTNCEIQQVNNLYSTVQQTMFTCYTLSTVSSVTNST